jgi:uncharacterized protein YdhG (YjbR/CyaY superfamily)
MPETKAAKKTAATSKQSEGFTADERAAMRERAKDLKAEARATKDREAGERDILEKIGEMSEPDKSMAERIHAIVKEVAPHLAPRTWYGMPAYTKDGKVVCFFKPAEKFNSRYATFGFEEAANLDAGEMWVTSYALTGLTPEGEAKIRALVEQAAS